MQIRFTHKAIIFFFLLFAIVAARSAIVSRITTFTDGSILTASQLNSEFNNIINTVNSLDNDNLSATANISPAKISAVIAGSGITVDGGTGALSVNPDGVGLEVSGDSVQIKDNGVTAAKFEQIVGLSIVGRADNTTGNVAAITAASDNQILRRSGASIGFGSLGASTVGSSQITDESITSSDILNGTITSTDILDGTITSTDIANSTITSSDLATGSLTQAKRESLPYDVSNTSSSNYSSAATSSTNVPNMTVTVTSNGRPVYVGVIPDGSTSGCSIHSSGSGYVNFNVDSVTNIGQFLNTSSDPAGCGIFTVYQPSAGSHTYKLSFINSSGTTYVYYAKIVAFEL